MSMQQGRSRVFRRGDGDGRQPGLIAHVFFTFDDAHLDAEDRSVIERASQLLKMQLFGGRTVRARVIGYADSRGSAAYNERLAMHRAETVQRVLDSYLHGSRAYTSVRVSQGERNATGSHSFDRRVDIVTNFQASHRFEDDVVVGQYRGPLSHDFKIRVLGGTSASVSLPLVPIGVGGASLAVEIWNVRTDQKAVFSFVGVSAGPGLKVGFNRPTEYVRMRSYDAVALKHFEGGGGMTTLSAGVDSGTVLIFDGPREHGVTRVPVEVTMGGWDLNIGAGVVRGRWERVGY